MSEIIFYASIALVCMAMDGITSHSLKIKYKVVGSFLMAMSWPVTLPIVIFACAKRTKDFDSEVKK